MQQRTPARQSAGVPQRVADGYGAAAQGLASGHTKLEVKVTDVEGEAESAEVVDQQGGEENQQDAHQNPKQRPQEGRHSVAHAHGRASARKKRKYAGNPAQGSTRRSSTAAGQLRAGFASFAAGLAWVR